MRAIAQGAGVSLGIAYYHFGSKEQLVQEFYLGIQEGHRRRAAAALRKRNFVDRLRGVLLAGIDEMAPYHSFAGSFIRVAVPPSSAASPFSPESGTARQAAVNLFRDVVEGSSNRPGGAFARDLPHLLWLAYLALTVFWVYDTSPDQERTRHLADGAAGLVGNLATLSRLPLLRGPINDLHTLLSDLLHDGEPEGGAR
jgi:AcrR family transcriptional regulator